MHALALMLAPNKRAIYTAIEWINGEEYWDYYVVGGRFKNILPVSKKCKSLIDNLPLDAEVFADLPDGRFPYEYGPITPANHEQLRPHPNLKYTSCARIRNINQDECRKFQDCHLASPLDPYTYILARDEEPPTWLDPEDMTDEWRTYIDEIWTNPKYNFYFAVVLDYHT